MANKKNIEALSTDDLPIEAMSLDEIQREIAQVQLQTARLGLAEQKKTNAEFIQKEAARREANKRRMDELQVARNNRYATIRECRHRSGGNPKRILRGGGKNSFSLISRSVMPDGVTVLLHCQRCRLALYTPVENGSRQLWFKTYAEEQAYYEKRLEESIEEGCSEHNEQRGPTFMFQNAQGVPVVPARV